MLIAYTSTTDPRGRKSEEYRAHADAFMRMQSSHMLHWCKQKKKREKKAKNKVEVAWNCVTNFRKPKYLLSFPPVSAAYGARTHQLCIHPWRDISVCVCVINVDRLITDTPTHVCDWRSRVYETMAALPTLWVSVRFALICRNDIINSSAYHGTRWWKDFICDKHKANKTFTIFANHIVFLLHICWALQVFFCLHTSTIPIVCTQEQHKPTKYFFFQMKHSISTSISLSLSFQRITNHFYLISFDNTILQLAHWTQRLSEFNFCFLYI